MQHTIEPASSGRAKCRGCGQSIAKGVIRFGEVLPNPFSDGNTMTHWFHLPCAAMKRPDPFLETMPEDQPLPGSLADADHGFSPEEIGRLREIARQGLAHRRVSRVDGAERAPSGRARCRHCKEMIEKDAWRVKLVFYEEGMFNPAGFIHLACSPEYLETSDIASRIAQFSPQLTGDDLESIQAALQE